MNQNFSLVLLRQSSLNLYKLFHKSGVHLGTHYETLKLPRDCTTKEIKDSFIKLSKKNHPDVNKDPRAHKEFLKIQEAYNVLSKSGSRTSYDLGLSNPFYHNVKNTHPGRSGEASREYSSWDEPYFYQNKYRPNGQYEQQPYYGIKGVNKASNGMVAFIVIMLTAASFIGQMIVINVPNVRPWDKQYKEKSVKK